VTYTDLVQTAGVTMCKVHDAKVMDNRIREDDTAVSGDRCNACDAEQCAAVDRCAVRGEGEGEAGPPSHEMPARAQSPLRLARAKIKHVFRLHNCAIGCRKVAIAASQERRASVRAPRARELVSRPRPPFARIRENGAEKALIRCTKPRILPEMRPPSVTIAPPGS
jgi:hypothetical protein